MATIATIERRPRKIRSRVGNGTALFTDTSIDGRSTSARRFSDVLSEIMSDLGGVEGLSEGQRQIARRAALMAVECERMEGEAVAGKAIDLETFGKLSDRLGRAFRSLGLKRVAKPMTTNSLADHFDRP